MVDLRPSTVEGSDLFARMTRLIYRLDNSQNVFPSGHALGAFLMAAGWDRIVKRPWQRLLVWFVNAGIVLSTLFLKQHSVIDLAGGIVLAVLINRVFEWIIRKRQAKAVTAFWSRAAYTGHDRDHNAL